MQKIQKKNYINGRWFKINKKIKKKIIAKYDRIKDWVIDPKGYFLIDIDKKKKILKVGYCTINKKKKIINSDMIAEVNGKTAIEVLNTLIKYNYISSLQHAGDMGIELCKAELAIKYNLNYIQDKELNIQ